MPLVIVLGVSMVKEGIEDYRRYRADREVNSRPVEVGAFLCQVWEQAGRFVWVGRADQQAGA